LLSSFISLSSFSLLLNKCTHTRIGSSTCQLSVSHKEREKEKEDLSISLEY
jgi:hypothetical protein